jgi:hypothetical protein
MGTAELNPCAVPPIASNETRKDIDQGRSIILRGEIDLAHDVRVVTCLGLCYPRWINWLETTACLTVSVLCIYRFANTGDLIALLGSVLCALFALLLFCVRSDQRCQCPSV